MKANDLKERTIVFSARIMDLVESLPESRSVRVVSDQILRSSSSVGANYRAAGRSNPRRTLSTNLRLLRKKPMKPFIGWSCYKEGR
jgi:four helix bundle protein